MLEFYGAILSLATETIADGGCVQPMVHALMPCGDMMLIATPDAGGPRDVRDRVWAMVKLQLKEKDVVFAAIVHEAWRCRGLSLETRNRLPDLMEDWPTETFKQHVDETLMIMCEERGGANVGAVHRILRHDDGKRSVEQSCECFDAPTGRMTRLLP